MAELIFVGRRSLQRRQQEVAGNNNDGPEVEFVAQRRVPPRGVKVALEKATDWNGRTTWIKIYAFPVVRARDQWNFDDAIEPVLHYRRVNVPASVRGLRPLALKEDFTGSSLRGGLVWIDDLQIASNGAFWTAHGGSGPSHPAQRKRAIVEMWKRKFRHPHYPHQPYNTYSMLS